MSRSESRQFPVTVSKLPVTRCDVCGKTLAYRPGQASAVLTQHYTKVHPDAHKSDGKRTSADIEDEDLKNPSPTLIGHKGNGWGRLEAWQKH